MTEEKKPKTIKKTTAKKTAEFKTVEKTVKKTSLQVDVLDLAGKVVESISLPEDTFNAKVNPVLMSQAVRVYLANQRQGNASTKSRNEVTGSTRKIYRQKGTGRARHGSKKAPIFVHGGIAHGPKPIDHSLTMSKSMRRNALSSALTSKAQAQEILVVTGLAESESKTKIIATLLKATQLTDAKTLLVMPTHIAKVHKAARNINSVIISAMDKLNTYEVLNNKKIIFMKEAIETIGKSA